MRALTLTQPWAGLVASGLKLVENRPRLMIRREDFGVPFAIHASREVDVDVVERIREIAPDLFSDDVLKRTPEWLRLGGIRSAVIGVATIDRAVVQWRDGQIVDAYGCDGTPVIDLGDQRRWFFGPIGYVLRDVRALAEPVSCRGWQGFWTLSPEVERAVTAQIASAG